ncbi:aspartic peptidase domain-containing protein [Mycena maculata]|uniref:Aspartic peptidase domain-containing protein n=1 Tax=Mycena maculata TaxID=230809 RepID=A0AAD7HSL6_9AGAR|nr:aspartic peptidase domain-containing protein [Mycena maculata]
MAYNIQTMWCSAKFYFPVLVALFVQRANALAVKGTRRSPHSPGERRAATNGNTIFTLLSNGTDDNEMDMRYSTNITVNGRTFEVAIDTGSADLWIFPPADFVFNNTGIAVTDSYGDGSTTDVVGTIGFASVQLGGYTFDSQAFNNATTVGLGGILNLGLEGLMGFDFGVETSFIKDALAAAHLDETLGEPFLSNIFDQTPGQENFLAISLSRTGDLEGTADASFLISEIDQRYADVVFAPAIPLFPGTNGRWSIQIDGISLDNVSIAVTPSTVAGTPPGKIVALMDTGTPTASFPADFIDRLFSAIPGSVQAADGSWTIPCDTTSILSVEIGGQQFPISPLDLSDVDSSTGTAICSSPFLVVDGTTEFDSLFGDTIMRNIYSVFNFGDAVAKAPTDNATMQFLAQTDPTLAKADVQNVRMARLYGQQGTSPAGFAATADTTASSTPGSSDALLSKYGPIVVGLLGANLLVVLILAVVGLVLCVRRGGQSAGRIRTTQYAPVKVQVGEDETRALDGYEDKRYSD